MTAVFPEGVPAEGAITILFVPTLTVPAVPTATVLNGGTAINLSCYIKAGGFSIESSQGEIEDRRFCSTTSASVPGRVKESFGDMTYVYNPQAADGDAENEAYETLTPGTSGYLVLRYGLPVNTAFAAAQKVDVFAVTWGNQRKDIPADGEGEVLTATSRPFTPGVVHHDVAVA